MIECPHVAADVVMQSDTVTGVPPGVNAVAFEPATCAQFAWVVKNMELTCACDGEAYPKAAAITTTDMRKIFVRFIFCLCTS